MGVSTVSEKENCAPPSRTANVMGETLQCAFADASTRGLFGSDPERPFEALFLLRAFDRKAEGRFPLHRRERRAVEGRAGARSCDCGRCRRAG